MSNNNVGPMSNAYVSRFIYKKFPKFVSIVFHPLLMPTLGVYIILNSGTYVSFMQPEAKNMILLVVFTCTFGLPLAFIPLVYHLKLASSLEMDQSQERIIPLVITASLYYLSFYLMKRLGVAPLIQSFLIASAIAVCVNLIITSKWKVSAHMIGIGGVIGLIASLSVLYSASTMFYMIIAVILSGLIGYSRLSLNAHSPAQVYVGLGTGVMVMLLTMCLF